jgi:hypothetical protein
MGGKPLFTTDLFTDVETSEPLVALRRLLDCLIPAFHSFPRNRE